MIDIRSGRVLLLLAAMSAAPASGAQFAPLPTPPDAQESRALSVADDGATVAGVVHVNSHARAFRWSSGDEKLTLLDDLAGGATGSQGTAVSGDGQAVVGMGQSAAGSEAFVQLGNAPPTGLGDLAGGFFASHARSASYNAAQIVGTAHSAIGREAFRWSTTTGMQGLGYLPLGVASEAFDVSANGNVVVGVSETFDMILGEAFRWTAAEGMTALGDLPGGDAMSRATAVSAAGNIVIGQSSSTSGLQAFRWTAAAGMVGLGDLDGGTFSSIAYDVVSDGSVIVGAGHTDDANTVAFIWTADQGMRSLSDLLANDYALADQLDGWNLIAAHAITPDARAIVGTGINPNGELQAWHVWLGEQTFMEGGHSSDDVLLGLGDQLTGYGEISGRVHVGAGGTLFATGDWQLGAAALADAVRLDGSLDINRQHVQLRSATPIPVAGAIWMDIPDGPDDDDCCRLEFDTIHLQGTIHGGRLVGGELELQSGAVLGPSAEHPAIIESRIVGRGYLDHVEIRDELAPGIDEPVELRLGNVRYDSAQLVLDLRGPSDQFDRLHHDGRAEIVGRLQVRIEPHDDYALPTVGGTYHTFAILTADELTLTEDASIDVLYDGEAIGSLTGGTAFVNRHVGSGLFRMAEHDDAVLRVTNYRAIAGDADGDGRFATADLIQVLGRGKYEDALPLNADWTDGDWNLDGDFSSSDLVAALQTGAYEGPSVLPAVAAVPEPASSTLALLACGVLAAVRRRLIAPAGTWPDSPRALRSSFEPESR